MADYKYHEIPSDAIIIENVPKERVKELSEILQKYGFKPAIKSSDLIFRPVSSVPIKETDPNMAKKIEMFSLFGYAERFRWKGELYYHCSYTGLKQVKWQQLENLL